MHRRIAFLSTLAFVLIVSACAEREGAATAEPDTTSADSMSVSGREAAVDLYATLSSDPRFTRFAALVDSVGLSPTLESPGPYTVFAPTNEAFEADPVGDADIRGILLIHVSNGVVKSTDLNGGTAIPTLEGSEVSINRTGGAITVDGATVIESDIEASNGVIHAIDAVLRPRSDGEGF